MTSTRGILLLLGVCCLPPQILEAADTTTIEVLVGGKMASHRGPDLRVPAGTDTLTFQIQPKSPLVRYTLEGLDKDWKQRDDTIVMRVRFYNRQGEPRQMIPFPASGRSMGWNGSVEDSVFTPRMETLTVPPDAASMSLFMSTAGPASLIGVFAIKDVSLTSVAKPGGVSKVLISDSRLSRGQRAIWNKSGSDPSMATRLRLGARNDASPIFVIVDDDLSAHADWVTRIPIPSDVAAGETLELRWNETYSTGLGGDFTTTYERLPAGNYRFVVQDLSLTGEPLPSVTAVSLAVPAVFWKTFWFWGTIALFLSTISILIGRFLIRRRIRRDLDQERMISEERRRIALDLHDDIGTRVSHISLLASHAGNTQPHNEANQAFEKISSMSRDLIGALSETVWMLNSKNDDLESLVDFLYRLVNELCRLKKIRCRVDAVFITENQAISYEFRHNVSLAVKESVNNVLKHSHATELEMKIELERNTLLITITDNGIGISEESRSSGLGLDNLERRMKSIGGTCRFEHLKEGGLRILFTAPLAMTPKPRTR